MNSVRSSNSQEKVLHLCVIWIGKATFCALKVSPDMWVFKIIQAHSNSCFFNCWLCCRIASKKTLWYCINCCIASHYWNVSFFCFVYHGINFLPNVNVDYFALCHFFQDLFPNCRCQFCHRTSYNAPQIMIERLINGNAVMLRPTPRKLIFKI